MSKEIAGVPASEGGPKDYDGVWEKFKITFFYDTSGIRLSRTAVINFVFAFLAFLAIIAGLIAFIIILHVMLTKPNFKLDPAFVDFCQIYFTVVGSLVAIASTAYSFGKKIDQ